MSETAISLKGIEKSYGKHQVLDDVTLDIEKGHIFGHMTGRQNLEYYRRLKGIRDKKEIDRVLEIVGLSSAKGPVSRYSLGMRQRLGIANAILGTPEILILDEPTYGMTIIVSSHILGELQHTADQFGIVKQGRIPKTVTQEELIHQQNAVRISVDDLERARAVLKEAGISILGEASESRSLEDFYFDVVEEENHA